jgi:hypothetical protein
LTNKHYFIVTPSFCNLRPFKSIADANLRYFAAELTTSILSIFHLLAGPFLCTSVGLTDLTTVTTHIAHSGSDTELADSELIGIEKPPQF